MKIRDRTQLILLLSKQSRQNANLLIVEQPTERNMPPDDLSLEVWTLTCDAVTKTNLMLWLITYFVDSVISYKNTYRKIIQFGFRNRLNKYMDGHRLNTQSMKVKELQ